MSFTVISSRCVGPFSRYRIDVCRTRFGDLHYMVFDAEIEDEITGGPACIRQADTEEEALSGLLGKYPMAHTDTLPPAGRIPVTGGVRFYAAARDGDQYRIYLETRGVNVRSESRAMDIWFDSADDAETFIADLHRKARKD